MIDMSTNMLYHIRNLDSENVRISRQMATKKEIDNGSENSLLHSNLINLEDKLRISTNLQLQLSKTKVVNTTADTSLADMKKALDKIKVDLLKGLNAGMDRSDKLALATNLRGIRENMFDLANANVDGEYVFTGSETTKQTLTKDANFELNGKLNFGGDGFLRRVAVQPGSYRERGVTAYDVSFYNSTKAGAGESFTFESGERIIDENGHEWKLNSAMDKLQQYDHNGLLYDPPVELAVNLVAGTGALGVGVEATGENQAIKNQFTITNISTATLGGVANSSVNPDGRVFEAKRNYFDDLNITINALEGHSTKLDGTKGGIINDESVRDTVSKGLEQSKKQYDATNIGHGELGGRNAVFNVAHDQLSAQITHYNILIEETGSADLAKLAMESKALEITYQSLYSTIAKMNNLSLVNYIK